MLHVQRGNNPELRSVVENIRRYARTHLSALRSQQPGAEAGPAKFVMALHQDQQPGAEAGPAKFVMALHQDQQPGAEAGPAKFVMALHEGQRPGAEAGPAKFVMALHEGQQPGAEAGPAKGAAEGRSFTTAIQPSFFDWERNLANCWTASATVRGEAVRDVVGFKVSYLDALNALQQTRIPQTAAGIVLSFDDEWLIHKLVDEGVFAVADLENGKHLFHELERERIVSSIRNAFDYILAVDAELCDLVTRMIGTIIAIKKDGHGGGTVSSLIGVIWLNPQPSWTIVDYADSIIHEFIHNTLFLDDMLWGVFSSPSQLSSPEALVVSALLKRPRGYDKAFHSAAVALGLAIFHRTGNQWNRATERASGLDVTLKGLQEKRYRYLTEHGRALLEQMRIIARDYV
jgi:hypothetical protein